MGWISYFVLPLGQKKKKVGVGRNVLWEELKTQVAIWVWEDIEGAIKRGRF